MFLLDFALFDISLGGRAGFSFGASTLRYTTDDVAYCRFVSSGVGFFNVYHVYTKVAIWPRILSN